jgi:flavin reductase (DIM6/NTAB) family NADH-FMN oxidoreductase RutF
VSLDRKATPVRPTSMEFRRALALYATGVTVVTTRAAGIDHAMTANSFTSVSLDPMLVLVCVERTVRFHEAVLHSGSWAVSVLGEDDREASEWFALRGRPLTGQLERFPHTHGPVTGAAILSSALASLEARTTAVYDGGDHDIVVGEVLALAQAPGNARPLIYFASDYRELR